MRHLQSIESTTAYLLVCNGQNKEVNETLFGLKKFHFHEVQGSDPKIIEATFFFPF